jgi:ATP-dependent DNA ligase
MAGCGSAPSMDTIGAVAIPLSCEGGDKMFAAKLERIRSLLRANFRLRSGWRRARDGIQYVEHTEGHGEKLFEAVCDLGLEASCPSGAARSWMPRIVCLIKKGVPDFDTLHGRTADHLAVGCAFDLLMHDGDDLRASHQFTGRDRREPGSKSKILS